MTRFLIDSSAIELGLAIMQSSLFQIPYLTTEDHATIWNIFSHYSDKDWSYIDCSLLAIARRMHVYNIFAFDRHFNQMTELVCEPHVW